MRINKIEIENLNSLKGHWEIDLNHPDYKKNHDLFVIYGETGSGKTTILDAITLALYGRTPRQSDFSGSVNELMTRHTSSCMARVFYECKKGKYSSEFSQAKARGKWDGKLQQTECQIINLETGNQEFSGRATKLAAKTAEIVQLDYNQFCRSIMLAQGEFDKFISDEKGEDIERKRAEILAKLTGTEKYRAIGAAIGEKASKVERDFSDKKREYESEKAEILSDEEIADFENQKKTLTKKIAENKKSLEKVLEGQNWLKQIDEGRSGKDLAEKARAEYETLEKDFEDKKQVLLQSEKAKNCRISGKYDALKTLRSDNENDTKALAQSKDILKEKTESLEKAETEAGRIKKQIDEREKELSENRDLWKKVQGLDSKIEAATEKSQKSQELCEEAKSAFEKAVSEKASLEKEISELEKSIGQDSKYLEENKKDGEIAKKLSALEVQKNEIKGKFAKIDEFLMENDKFQANLSEFEGKKAEFDQKIAELDGKLHGLVDTEYLAISALIRKSLEKGKPCPVCGSVDHPMCGDSGETAGGKSAEAIAKTAGGAGETMATAESVEKLQAAEGSAASANQAGTTANLAGNIAALNKSLDDAKAAREENQKKIDEITIKISENQKNLDEVKSETGQKISQMEGLLKDWNLKISSENAEKTLSSISQACQKLGELKNLFENATKRLADNQSSQKAKKARLEGIDTENLEKNYEKARTTFEADEKGLKELSENRQKLFGQKNPDEEEKKMTAQVEDLKKSAEEAEENLKKAATEKSAEESKVSQLEKQIADRAEKLSQNQKVFEKALKENGFADEKAFLDCNLNQEEYENLLKQQEDLKKMDAKTAAELKKESRDLEALLAQKKTEKSAHELDLEKSTLESESEEANRQLGEIDSKFKENALKQENFAKITQEFEKIREENAIWAQMKEFIGVKGGADFEVFVQSLAFKNLLILANKYLEAISGKYTFSQIENKVDFLIHDKNYSEEKEDRPVSNMSGGEKFIISLSLALGIAELASHNVRVDSLFLDEGFGTLSGEPLTQSINALKQLQNSGKMLGIITHVETVIKEFDQKIEVVKKTGGSSAILGSGISHY